MKVHMHLIISESCTENSKDMYLRVEVNLELSTRPQSSDTKSIITLIWVLGHCEYQSNEIGEGLAKKNA